MAEEAAAEMERLEYKERQKAYLTRKQPQEFLLEKKKESLLHWDSQDLTSPEQLIDVPEDLESNWITVMLPRGERCIVTACQGQTRAENRDNGAYNVFASYLPGGSSTTILPPPTGKKVPVTVLDCIFDTESMMFWVIDVIAWAGTQTYLAPAEIRLERRTKVWFEFPDLEERAEENPYPFRLVPTFPSTARCLLSSMLQPLNFHLEGILLVHKKGRYFPTSTPLVMWANPGQAWFPAKVQQPRQQQQPLEQQIQALATQNTQGEQWNPNPPQQQQTQGFDNPQHQQLFDQLQLYLSHQTQPQQPITNQQAYPQGQHTSF